jgi:hypothetical protein
LNDRGRAIAFGCKADGNIWYEVRRSNGTTGWASARYLDLASGTTSRPTRPVVETRVTFNCLTGSRLTLEIFQGGREADVTISRKTYRLQRRDSQSLRYSFQSRDGARLLGGRDIVEWRWPDGTSATCIR